MTQADIPSRIIIPSAFASKSTFTLPDGSATSEGNVVNFADGFPSVYGCPSGGNGKFVTRDEMNALGKVATLDHYIRACGGVFQFDPQFAALKGGYAKGAILDYVVGNRMYKVISLVDNNLVDYTGGEPVTVGSVSTISGKVDGINWMYCMGTDGVNQDDVGVICEIGDYDGSKSVVQEVLVRCFCAPMTGLFGVSGSAAFNQTSPEGSTNHYSVGIWIKEGTNDPDSLAGETLDTSTDKKIFHTGSSAEGGNQGTTIAKCTKGNWYAVYLTLTYAKIENSTLKVRID